jgi:hypothetical protein
MGILIAIPIVVAQSRDILALPERLQPGAWGEWLGLAVLAAIAWLLYRSVMQRARGAP